MKSELWLYDIRTLRALYEQERECLSDALLNGLPWEAVQDQRRKVTEISIVIHNKILGRGNPAEKPGRDHPWD